MQCKEAGSGISGPWMVGIDEAGRGPVVGPMVYAAAYCPVAFLKQLEESGVADSKSLTAQRREEHFQKVQETLEIGYCANAIPPSVISYKMLENLNLIALESTIKILKAIRKRGFVIDHIYVDTVGPAATHAKRLEAVFPDLHFTVRAKADVHFPIVSLASIMAKVLRDRDINVIQKRYGDVNIGSGYPSDPHTTHWLQTEMDPVFGFLSDVRFSWTTCVKLLDKNGVKVTWEQDQEYKKQRRITSCVVTSKNKSNCPFSLFTRARNLQPMHEDPFV